MAVVQQEEAKIVEENRVELTADIKQAIQKYVKIIADDPETKLNSETKKEIQSCVRDYLFSWLIGFGAAIAVTIAGSLFYVLFALPSEAAAKATVAIEARYKDQIAELEKSLKDVSKRIEASNRSIDSSNENLKTTEATIKTASTKAESLKNSVESLTPENTLAVAKAAEALKNNPNVSLALNVVGRVDKLEFISQKRDKTEATWLKTNIFSHVPLKIARLPGSSFIRFEGYTRENNFTHPFVIYVSRAYGDDYPDDLASGNYNKKPVVSAIQIDIPHRGSADIKWSANDKGELFIEKGDIGTRAELFIKAPEEVIGRLIN